MTAKYRNTKKNRRTTYSTGSRRRGRRRFRRFPKLLLPVLLLFCFLSYEFPEETQELLSRFDLILPDFLPGQGETAPGSGDFEVHFLDVGQGLSVLVRSDGHALLYDGGDREASSFVVSYLKRQGIETLDYVVASHYDSDHINGLIGALNVFSVETVIGPDYVHDSKTYDSFMQTVADCGLPVTHPAVGSVYALGDSSFTVLSPQEIVSESNNNSVAIRIVNGQNSFLLSGDAEYQSEEAMCYSGLPLSSDVICPGHHGSSNATSSLFLSYTRPKYAVISVGADNDYGHPHSETLQRLSDYGVTVYRTDLEGTIVAYSDGEEISWKFEK